MRIARPEFRPDPDASRAAMEAAQAEIADEATFTDRFSFDPAPIGPDDPTVGPDAGSGDNDAPAARQTGDRADAGKERAADEPERAPLVAGVDQAFLDDRAVSAIVVSRRGRVVERAHAVAPVEIPYVPGLLSFREGGSILAAVEELSVEPDLWLFDGSGRIHFREAGLATHLGVTLDAPAIGVAKNLLCGEPDATTDGRPVGWQTPIRADGSVTAADGTVIGHAYQSRQYDTRPIVNPVYVSPGHRVSAERAVELVARTCAGYKLPEPTRRADAFADDLKSTVE